MYEEAVEKFNDIHECSGGGLVAEHDALEEKDIDPEDANNHRGQMTAKYAFIICFETQLMHMLH